MAIIKDKAMPKPTIFTKPKPKAPATYAPKAAVTKAKPIAKPAVPTATGGGYVGGGSLGGGYVGGALPATTPATSTAAAPAAPATGTPAAVTTGTPQANAYPWLDQQFGKYFQAIQQDFADRGLLDSTNKLQPMTELADAYSARWAQEARTDNQAAISNALALWERLTSANLARQNNELAAGMDYKYEGVAQPSIFADIFKNVYLPPTKSSGGPIGDAPVVERRPTMTRPLGVDTSRGNVIPTYTESAPNYAYRDQRADAEAALSLARQQEARLAQQAAQDAAIQNAYLKIAQEQGAAGAAEDASDDEKWAAMSDIAMNNYLAGKQVPGSNQTPTDLLNTFLSAYNIDVVGLAKQGDPRAISLIKSMYGDPEYEARVLSRMGVPGYSGVQTARPQSKATTHTQPTGLFNSPAFATLLPPTGAAMQFASDLSAGLTNKRAPQTFTGQKLYDIGSYISNNDAVKRFFGIRTK